MMADEVVIWSQVINGRVVSGGSYSKSATGNTFRPFGAAGDLWSGAPYPAVRRRRLITACS